MGIPKYFSYISNRYKSLIQPTNDSKVKINSLYFDMNGLIHPCVRKAIQNKPDLVKEYNRIEKTKKFKEDFTYITQFEKEVYKHIGDQVDYVIDNVDPDKLVYMAIDGVAPRAKMEQQRIRRFRTIKQKTLEDIEYKKHDIDRVYFDTNCITPGTIFMYKLSEYLKKYIQEKRKTLNIAFILDDSQRKGEGEHKAIQYIKNFTNEDTNCIYGLDADLIMLSLCSHLKIYLLRETVHFGRVYSDQLLYLDIYGLGDKLYSEISEKINKDLEESIELTRESIINDYICLCFFIGNDFLPHIVGVDISNNSINDLLATYINIYRVRQKPLTDGTNINFIFVKQILTKLYSEEDKYLIKYQNRIEHFTPRLEYNNDLELEIEKIKFYPIYHKDKSISLGKYNWIDKYYLKYFGVVNIYKNQDFITDICNNYIDGLQWNIKYYLDKCPSEDWYYRYRAAPCLRELCRHLLNRVYPTNFVDNIEYTPLEQLSIVLPYQSSHLWAESYKHESENDVKLASFYPLDIKIDTLNKRYLHECNPILMDIDDKYIQSVFRKIKLTKNEIMRNVRSNLYMVGYEDNENIKIDIS